MITPNISISQLKKQLGLLLSDFIPVFIHGAPGIGKSYIVNEIAKEHGWEVSDVRLSQLESVDLRGIPAIVDGKTVWAPPIFFPSDGEGILFLDELNSAHPSIQSAVYQLVLDRKIGEYTLPKGWRIACAGNRIADKGIVFRLPSPLANRMVHLTVEAKFDDFKQWGLKNSVHHTILGFLGFRPDLVSQESPKETETNPAFATPRSWTMLSKVLNKNLPIHTISPIVYGSVGYAVGVEYLAYLKTYGELPSIEAILEGEEPTPPTSPAALFALTSALIERFEPKHAVNLLNYSKLLPVEFGVMLIKDAIVKSECIAELAEFDEWLNKYGEYVL